MQVEKEVSLKTKNAAKCYMENRSVHVLGWENELAVNIYPAIEKCRWFNLIKFGKILFNVQVNTVILSHALENKIDGWKVFVDQKGHEVKDKEIFKHQISYKIH